MINKQQASELMDIGIKIGELKRALRRFGDVEFDRDRPMTDREFERWLEELIDDARYHLGKAGADLLHV